MKKHLNTLFVTTQGAYVACEGEAVLVRVEEETKLRVPIHMIGGIVCFGRVSCSPWLMGLCGEHGVTISYLTEHGKFLARVEGPVSGNVLLRRAQYRHADDHEKAAELARSIVTAKVANCRTALLRTLRDHPESDGAPEVRAAINHLDKSLDQLEQPLSLDTVRGIEGDSARSYFEVFNHLIVAQKESFAFKGRSRRPPLDNINRCCHSCTLLLPTMRGRRSNRSGWIRPSAVFTATGRDARGLRSTSSRSSARYLRIVLFCR